MSQTFREQQTLSNIPPECADRMLAEPKPDSRDVRTVIIVLAAIVCAVVAVLPL